MIFVGYRKREESFAVSLGVRGAALGEVDALLCFRILFSAIHARESVGEGYRDTLHP